MKKSGQQASKSGALNKYPVDLHSSRAFQGQCDPSIFPNETIIGKQATKELNFREDESAVSIAVRSRLPKPEYQQSGD